MTDQTFSVGTPYVRQIKETSFEQSPSGAYDQQTELPGFLELCVDVNGAPWVIARRKAPGLLADIERAQAAQPAPPTPTPTPTAAQQQ
jgi:hypothetical protein